MSKQKYLIIFAVLFLGLGLSIFQYAKTFQTEIAGATSTIPNPGHAWAEMECNTDGLCISGNKLGIGTNVPAQSLDVNGKIVMRSQTAANDPATTVVTKGYLSSYTSPTQKVLVGANPICPVGTDTIMYADTSNVWHNSPNEGPTGVWNQVMCGQRIAVIDGDTFLVNNNHTRAQCESTTYAGVAGVWIDDGSGNKFCKFNSAACTSVPAPNGTGAWAQYQNWSTTQSVTGGCSGSPCNSASHATFSNVVPEWCGAGTYWCWPTYNQICHTFYSPATWGGGGCDGYPGGSSASISYSTITQVGCY